MGVFCMGPKSFKMERETPFANHLKTLIHSHLLHFGPHSDDVLAEYITVLVCNGKNQNQTMIDVEAFLGKRSREFISWLWCLLLKSEDQLPTATSSVEKYKISLDPSPACKGNDKRDSKHKLERSLRNNNSANLVDERGEKYLPLTEPCKSDHIPTSEDHPPPSSRLVQSRAHQSRSDDGDFVRKESSALVKPKTKLANSADKPALQQKNPESCALTSHGDKSGGNLVRLLTGTDCPQFHHTASASRRFLSPTSDSSSDNKKAQRSVWDRLGKPPKRIPYSQNEPPFHVMNKFKNTGEQSNQHKSTGQTGRISPLSRLTTDRGSGMTREAAENWDRVIKTVCPVQSVNNIGRKRHFSELNNQTLLAKSSDNQPEEVRQAQIRPEMQMDVSQAVVAHVQEIKQRLRQVEIEMAKLRSMQSRIEKDGKPASSTGSSAQISGVMELTDEDIESKTVIVTNVHPKATKEALTVYFQRCGSVVNVVIRDDEHLQRSAYITFESKKSTEMALGFGGKVFYSRTMMVSRKGDTTRPSLPRFVGDKNHNLVPHSLSCVTEDKHPFSSSHLQWRRESLASTDEPRKE